MAESKTATEAAMVKAIQAGMAPQAARLKHRVFQLRHGQASSTAICELQRRLP